MIYRYSFDNRIRPSFLCLNDECSLEIKGVFGLHLVVTGQGLFQVTSQHIWILEKNVI